MFKRFKALMLVIIVSFLIVGCGMGLDENNSDPNQNNNQNSEGEVQLPGDAENKYGAFTNEYKTILMENVASSDILFYEKIAFTSIEFNVRDSISYSVGKDFYRIEFLSSADPEDTHDAYVDYIDEVTDQFSNEYNRTIEGNVNGLPIAVDIVLTFNENRGGYPVSVRISENPAEFQEENPYYNEYPGLVELYNMNNQPHYYYMERYDEGFKEYYITFQSAGGTDDFAAFYTENYSQKTNFSFEEDDYQKRFSWTDSGFEHKVILQISNNMVGVYVKTTLP
ncbi:hypothetical protein [Alkalibacter saccharofermentans]|uniref:Lipoprotein n=1 Tax=Alkalibacter saccharofermentans DSM 14828 TaxID=1120975 RepID=A0A1M4ZD82_9FIRM|nr:hypothetical protein [Alkalibacter saccharofermentans]SHF15742.1 hypothetical protein SAMN02746064_02015 [Alkalibacter saccharofermentans DSM 14828]